MEDAKLFKSRVSEDNPGSCDILIRIPTGWHDVFVSEATEEYRDIREAYMEILRQAFNTQNQKSQYRKDRANAKYRAKHPNPVGRPKKLIAGGDHVS